MNLNRVAIAGGDESVSPEDLVKLSEQYPFVEWSILYDGETKPLNRFPSVEWIRELVRLSREREVAMGSPLNLSLHLCRKAVKDLFSGCSESLAPIQDILTGFQRIQLNVVMKNEYQYLPQLPENIQRLPRAYQIIVQLTGDALNEEVGEMLLAAGIDVAWLHDKSGGLGITVENWPAPKDPYCGYAGGLSPETLAEQLPRIAEAAGDHPFYIDLESGVRDSEDHFDLTRAEQVLIIVDDWMKGIITSPSRLSTDSGAFMNTNMPIRCFTGEYAFLNNFYHSPFQWEGIEWQMVEHAYQAAKVLDPVQRQVIASLPSPGKAKAAGSSVTIRSDWEDVKYDIMSELVYAKFTQNADLREKLLATGCSHLEDGNNHGNRIWGTVNGVGSNWLGKILMDVREKLRTESEPSEE